MKGPPNLIVDRDSGTGDIRVYVLLINLEGDTISYTGTGSYMITTTLLTEESSTYEFPSGNDIVFTIETRYGQVWESTVDDMMDGQGLIKGDGNDYNVSYDPSTELFVLTVFDVDELVVRSSFFMVTVT